VRRAWVREHGKLWCEGPKRPARVDDDGWGQSLPPLLFEQLRRLDVTRLGTKKATLFDWTRRDYAVARSVVGVVSVPGAVIEILPKLDSRGEGLRRTASESLLAMLEYAGELPVSARDVANVGSRRAPLSETLIAIFARSLVEALTLGVPRGYRELEDNLPTLRGRLLVGRQIQVNANRPDRFYCRFQRFDEDTRLNRILLATALVLMSATSAPRTLDRLRVAVNLLEGVEQVLLTRQAVERVVLGRKTQHFAELLAFCGLVAENASPDPSAGSHRTFSLLVDMDDLFERFVAGFFHRVVLRHPDCAGFVLKAQASGQRRHLLREVRSGRNVVELHPDLLFLRQSDGKRVVMDTKWKRADLDKRMPAGRCDLFQLHAYGDAFKAEAGVLLFPATTETFERDYQTLDTEAGQSRRVALRSVPFGQGLGTKDQRRKLAEHLRQILLEAFEGVSPPASISLV